MDTILYLGYVCVQNISKAAKVAKIKLAIHLGELFNEILADSTKIKMHRTKCMLLLKKGIAPCFLAELISDIDNSKYSLILDEFTDVSSLKYLCIMIRYFSKKKEKIITNYLGIIKITEATAQKLFLILTSFLKSINLELENLIAIGTDGANNMCGSQNSLCTLLKSKIHNLVLVKCVCHSFNLCASKAVECLPETIDFLVKQTYIWFSHSPLRRERYKVIYRLINDNSEPDWLMNISETRWLSRYNAVKKILEQFLELKTHFQMCDTSEKCHITKILSDLYTDKSIIVYLKALSHTLKKVNMLNLLFQRDKVEFSSCLCDIVFFIKTLFRKVIVE